MLLLIEVADSSSHIDRRLKLPAYAAAEIPEVWLADLRADRIEVHREPTPKGFESVRIAERRGALTPLALARVTLRVDEVLG